jgi:hypothetical protein
MTLLEEIEAATTLRELHAMARRLQVHVPAKAPFSVLKTVLMRVCDREVHTEPVCDCTHLIRQHFVDNVTGEAFECKVCDCKQFHKKIVVVPVLTGMTHASLDDLKAVYALFYSRRDIFPHIRSDALRRRIEAHQCIYQDGVVITFQQYRKRTRVGSVDVPKGAIMLHQILNGSQYNGAGRRVFNRFFQEIVVPSGGDLYLSVRADNKTARDFYERHGMYLRGSVSWSDGTLPGCVYIKIAK